MQQKEIKKIVNKMIEEKMSIRDMAKELKMPKSTLHRHIKSNLAYLGEKKCVDLQMLFEKNKREMYRKGGLTKSKNERERAKEKAKEDLKEETKESGDFKCQL